MSTLEHDYILHALRNPYGHDDMKRVRHEAANLIESLQDAYENMRDFAEENGLNTTAVNR